MGPPAWLAVVFYRVVNILQSPVENYRLPSITWVISFILEPGVRRLPPVPPTLTHTLVHMHALPLLQAPCQPTEHGDRKWSRETRRLSTRLEPKPSLSHAPLHPLSLSLSASRTHTHTSALMDQTHQEAPFVFELVTPADAFPSSFRVFPSPGRWCWVLSWVYS